ncbi:hypothetical protein EBZ37_15280 [bacterium]|nr:hypothetical protein [bacterium]
MPFLWPAYRVSAAETSWHRRDLALSEKSRRSSFFVKPPAAFLCISWILSATLPNSPRTRFDMLEAKLGIFHG